MKKFFRFVFAQNVAKGSTEMEGQEAVALYEKMVLGNPAFDGPLPKRFYLYVKANRRARTVNFDEWESIPLFLMEFTDGLVDYEDSLSFPSMFDHFVNGMASNYITV